MSRVWILSGTGEGPGLVSSLLELGWRVRASVVTTAAAEAYDRHPSLEMQVGALSSATAIGLELEEARRVEDGFDWLIDATHPFATTVRRQLLEACATHRQAMVRVSRPRISLDPVLAGTPASPLLHLRSWPDLARQDLTGVCLLLAVGSRHIAKAVQSANGAAIHARVLPKPRSVRLALKAGVLPERIAALRPGSGPKDAEANTIEQALCRRWHIQAVLFRESGGRGERLWHELAMEMGLTRMLLGRPGEPFPPGGISRVELAPSALLQWLGSPHPKHDHPSPARLAGPGDTGSHHGERPARGPTAG